jgi:hypothetical protein
MFVPTLLVQGSRKNRQAVGKRTHGVWDSLEKNLMASPAVLQEDASSVAPGRTIVFEVLTSLTDFYRAAVKVKGLEFLAEYEDVDNPISPDEIDGWGYELDPNFLDEKRRLKKSVTPFFYLAMPDKNALSEVLSLWKEFQETGTIKRYGLAAWKSLFENLKDVRPWGPRDRVLASFKEVLSRAEEAGDAVTLFQLDMWWSASPAKRGEILTHVSSVVVDNGGQVLHCSEIVDIKWHGMLVEMPTSTLSGMASDVENHPSGLALVDDIQFMSSCVRGMAPDIELDNVVSVDGAVGESVQYGGDICAVLLDSRPLVEHQALVGRLDVASSLGGDETPGSHGTQMASIIIHGDRAKPDLDTLDIKLGCFPLLEANDRTPSNVLLLDLFYKAIVSICEDDGTGQPLYPSARIFNLSVGDPGRPFDGGRISSWARLIDHLSWKYKILFIISAGNRLGGNKYIPTNYEKFSDFDDDSTKNRDLFENNIVNDLICDDDNNLLSPAECINGITVGAAHLDGDCINNSRSCTESWKNNAGLPALTSRIGFGYKKTIKPDLIAPTGFEYIRWINASYGAAIRQSPCGGIQRAMLGGEGEVTKWGNEFSTSAATALASHGTIKIYQMLNDFVPELPEDQKVVLLKALVGHACQWPDSAQLLLSKFKSERYPARPDSVARYLGYGIPNFERVLWCVDNQVTLIGSGYLEADGKTQHEFSFSLPAIAGSNLEGVELLVSVAYFSPVNHGINRYQDVRFSIKTDQPFDELKRMSSSMPSHYACSRGTIHNYSLYASELAVGVDSMFRFFVNCKGYNIDKTDVVPYGIAVSLKTKTEVDIYTAVEQRLKVHPVYA